MALTKKDLVLTVAKETGITQVDVKRVIQRTLHHVIESLKTRLTSTGRCTMSLRA